MEDSSTYDDDDEDEVYKAMEVDTAVAGWFMMENPKIPWMMVQGSPILGKIHRSASDFCWTLTQALWHVSECGKRCSTIIFWGSIYFQTYPCN